MALEITGKLGQVLPLETGEGKNGPWKKQFFVVEFMDGNYPKKVCMSLWGDKTDAIRNIAPGKDVKVSFNVESREYNGRWYTDVRAWKVEMLSGSGASSGSPGNEIPPFEEPAYSGSGGGPDNDLPF